MWGYLMSLMHFRRFGPHCWDGSGSGEGDHIHVANFHPKLTWASWVHQPKRVIEGRKFRKQNKTTIQFGEAMSLIIDVMYFLCDGNCPVFWPLSYWISLTARNSIQHIAYTQIIHVFSNQQSPKECWILNWNVGSLIGSTPIPDRMVVYVCVLWFFVYTSESYSR